MFPRADLRLGAGEIGFHAESPSSPGAGVVLQLGSGVVKRDKTVLSVRIHSQAKMSRSSTSGPEWLKSGDRLKVHGPASGPGRREVFRSFIVHRGLVFFFLPTPPVISIPANPPYGEYLFFSSTVEYVLPNVEFWDQ